jgi:DNA-binding CsgD family transcriptional regulator
MHDWPLVGREEELARCERELVDEGRSIVLVAPPGTGKTRLLEELVQRVGPTAMTERIVGTRSAQPLGLAAAAALLPAEVTVATEPLDLFRSVRRDLLERAGGRRILVAVDDGHLLDPLSAALLHHLAVHAGVQLVVALRAGEPVEDAITALWRDGLATRVELAPLDQHDVERLLALVLEGGVDQATAWRLWNVAGGNPLYLREVLTEAIRTGALAAAHGVWRWHGEVRVGPRLRELVELRLAGLDDAERAVVSLLAVGELVDRATVEATCEPDAVVRLERRGFVACPSGDERTVGLDHPLFAEVVRSTMGATERARWCRLLADHVDPRRDGDLGQLRRTVWQLDGGVEVAADHLIRDAERAVSRFDAPLALRLAAAAVAAGGGPHARLVQGEAARWLGDHAGALAIAESLADAALDDDQRARLASLVAEAGFWGLGEAQRVQAALDRIAAAVAEPGASQRIDALRSALLLAAGDLRGGGELGLSIAADPTADPQARLRAVTAGGSFLGLVQGRPEATLDLCDGLLPVALAEREALPRGIGWVLAARITALTCLCRWDEVTNVLHPVRAAAIAEDDHETVSGSSLVLGRVALLRGDLDQADPLLREAVAALRARDLAGYLPWALGLLAQVAGQRGDVAAVVELERELAEGSWPVRLQDHEVALGRAWAAGARGEITGPVELLGDAAEQARAAGNRLTTGLLLHEATRLGADPRQVVPGLEAAAAGGGLPSNGWFLAHARALTDRDGAALDAVATTFEDHGLLLYAAEASAEAAAVHGRAGLRASATRSAGQAARRREACPGARTPVLARLVVDRGLTRREQEVCALAGTGLSNQAIADRLGVGIRTVEGHLLRGMAKLGIRARRELPGALGVARDA